MQNGVLVKQFFLNISITFHDEYECAAQRPFTDIAQRMGGS